MPSNRERENRAGYPKLTDSQVNLLIDSLMWSLRDHNLGDRANMAEETISQLLGFYTRRWGLPPALGGQLARIRAAADQLDSVNGT